MTTHRSRTVGFPVFSFEQQLAKTNYKKICITEKGMDMSVVILGGNECMEQKYKSLCRDYRHEAKVMVKPVGGVKRKMGNPDLVIFFTGAMSHKMLQGALGEIKGQDVIVEYCPTSSVSALKKVLEKYA